MTEPLTHITRLPAKLYSGFINFWFGPADARVYAVFRMAYAFAAMLSFLDMWFKRYSFYTDGGFIDHRIAYANNEAAGLISVFHHFHDPVSATWVFVIAGIAILFVGLGLFTRISIIAVTLFNLSYMNYNPLMLAGWDSIITIFGSIMMISPLSTVWSADSIIRKKLWNIEPRKQVPVYGLRMMQIQATVIYLSVAILRCSNIHWQMGYHLHYFMLSAYFNFSPDNIFAINGLVRFMNYFVSVLEIGIPILLFFYRTRWLGFLIGYSLHLAMLVTTNIYLFQISMFIIYLPFVRNFGELKDIFTLRKPIQLYNRFFKRDRMH